MKKSELRKLIREEIDHQTLQSLIPKWGKQIRSLIIDKPFDSQLAEKIKNILNIPLEQAERIRDEVLVNDEGDIEYILNVYLNRGS
jgi:hypothetical protein